MRVPVGSIWSSFSASTGEMAKRYGFIYVNKDNERNGDMSRLRKDSAGVPLIAARRQSVRNVLENWVGYDKERLHVVSTCNLSHYNQSVMVESGIGMAFVMEFSCNQDTLCLRPLEPALESGCVLVWKKNQALSPAMLRFIEHAKEYLEGIPQGGSAQ